MDVNEHTNIKNPPLVLSTKSRKITHIEIQWGVVIGISKAFGKCEEKLYGRYSIRKEYVRTC